MKVVSGQGIMPVTKASVSPVAFVHVVIVPGRAPEQESTDHCDHRTACDLELRCAPALSEGAADDGKASEDEDKRKSDMGQGKNGAVGDAFPQFARLTEMVGHEHRFAVPRHHRMHRAEQDGSRHGSEDSAHVSVGDVAETARHAAIEPTLDSDKASYSSPRTNVWPTLRPNCGRGAARSMSAKGQLQTTLAARCDVCS